MAAEMRESADAKDEAKDFMADNNKHSCSDTNAQIPATFGSSPPGEIHEPTIYYASAPTRHAHHAHLCTSLPF